MTKPIARDHIYRRRRFDAEIIELCVRWYITHRLSYRELAAMMSERGTIVSHTTILRWVIRYVPEFEKRWNRFARPVNTPWRVDETYIDICGKWNYFYRAVDKLGKTVDFLLRPDRTIPAAPAFLRKGRREVPLPPVAGRDAERFLFCRTVLFACLVVKNSRHFPRSVLFLQHVEHLLTFRLLEDVVIGPSVCQVICEDKILAIVNSAHTARRFLLDGLEFEPASHFMLAAHAARRSG